MKMPLDAISIILTVTLTALFGMFLGGLFGWVAGWLVPGIFVDHPVWDSNTQHLAAVVICAGGGIVCGGALGAFAVAIQALMEWRRGS